MNHDAAGHYERLAATYDQTWGHRPDYVEWMNGEILRRLNLTTGDHVADIGAGTGLFLRRLSEQVSGENPIVCIDPSQQMLDRLPADLRVLPVCAYAEDVATARVGLPYDKLDVITMKEAIHHVRDIPGTLRGLASWLVPGGRVLVVTAPPRPEYPLFQAARDRFAEGHPEPDHIADAMREAGLHTQLEHQEFPVTVDREHYFNLVRNRWMSVLSTFTDEELDAGLEEMEIAYPQSQLQFADRFAFVLGRRP
ncbi:MAG: class I SAM-dependent methyltransferase [Micromonosporaceae bacterium]